MARCLFITDRWPFPLQAFRYGTALRMRMLLQAAREAGHVIDLFCVPSWCDPQPADLTALQADFCELWGIQIASLDAVASPAPAPRTGQQLWRDLLRPALNPYWQDRFALTTHPRQIDALARVIARTKPDLILSHRLSTMALLRRLGRQLPPIVFDLDDVETQAYIRTVRQPPHWRTKPLQYLQYPALANMQRWAIRKARTTLVCSENDARALSTQYPAPAHVVAIPNAVPAPDASVISSSQTVLFLGTYGYLPNVQAANLLTQKIWPLVHARLPEARLLVAGRGCESLEGYQNPPAGVHFMGFVDDLNLLYQQTRVVACPILTGSGTRIKIIEAALAGRPVVSTAIGAEGLLFDPARNEIAIRDDIDEFAAELLRLLNDMPACEEMGRRARTLALQEYAESAIVRMLASLLS